MYGFSAGVFVSSIFVGAFAFGIGFDVGITSFWDRWNKGVRGLVLLREQLSDLYVTETMERHS